SGGSRRMASEAGAASASASGGSDFDLWAMRTALALARRGLGTVWPNPAVGCVIVDRGRIVGRGWTQPGGRPHGETEALRRAGGEAGRAAGPRRWPGQAKPPAAPPPMSVWNPAAIGAAPRPAPMR